MVTATFPREHEKSLSAALKQAVQSAHPDSSTRTVQEPLADLTYSLPPTPQLKLAGRVQNMLMFTPDGQMVAKNGFKGLFVVAQSLSQVEIPSVTAFAAGRLRQTKGVSELKISSQSAVSIAGLRGWEIVGTAVETHWKVPIVMYQVLLVGDRTYYLMQAEVPQSESKKYLPVLKLMARSFTLQKSVR